MTRARFIVVAGAIGAFSLCAAAQPVEKAVFDARLGALTPDNPTAYFELAEEIATEWPDDHGKQLARELFVLTFELDRRAEGRLSASVCLALADLASDDDERRRLLALASIFRARAVGAGGAPGGTIGAREASFTLATALGLFRSGEYGRAAAMLARPEVASLLRAYGAAIGGADLILIEVRSRPSCRQCRNLRVVRDTVNAKVPERLCPTCEGLPGPELTDAQRLMHLRLESMLLSDGAPTWSAQLIADEGAPLRVVDPDGLARRYGVDPSRTVWRDGAWATPPEEGGDANDEGDAGARDNKDGDGERPERSPVSSAYE